MGGYHSVRSLTVLVIISSECIIVSSVLLYLTLFFWTIILSFWFLPFLSLKVKRKSLINHILIYFFRRAKNSLHFSTNAHNLCVLCVMLYRSLFILLLWSWYWPSIYGFWLPLRCLQTFPIYIWLDSLALQLATDDHS